MGATLVGAVDEEYWENEERRKAQIEQDRINEENRIKAQQQAEAERKEREKQVEIDRKAREKEIEQQRKAGEIKARGAEKLKKEAAEAAQREKDRAAADAKVVAQNVPQVEVRPNIPAVAGTVSRVNWKFRIVNPQAIPRKYLTYRKNKNPFKMDRWDRYGAGRVISLKVGMAVRPTDGTLRVLGEN